MFVGTQGLVASPHVKRSPVDTCVHVVMPAGADTAAGIHESLKELVPSLPLSPAPAGCQTHMVSREQGKAGWSARATAPNSFHPRSRHRMLHRNRRKLCPSPLLLHSWLAPPHQLPAILGETRTPAPRGAGCGHTARVVSSCRHLLPSSDAGGQLHGGWGLLIGHRVDSQLSVGAVSCTTRSRAHADSLNSVRVIHARS